MLGNSLRVFLQVLCNIGSVCNLIPIFSWTTFNPCNTFSVILMLELHFCSFLAGAVSGYSLHVDFYMAEKLTDLDFWGFFPPTHPPQYIQSLFKRDKGLTPFHSSFFKCNFYISFLNILAFVLFLPMSSYFTWQNKAWINDVRNCIILYSKQREKYL